MYICCYVHYVSSLVAYLLLTCCYAHLFFGDLDMLVTQHASERKLVRMEGTRLEFSECISLRKWSSSV